MATHRNGRRGWNDTSVMSILRLFSLPFFTLGSVRPDDAEDTWYDPAEPDSAELIRPVELEPGVWTLVLCDCESDNGRP